MDDLFEATLSDDSNGLDIGETEEAALYSAVHHSEDTYETNMLDLSENYISQRNKAFRLDSVKRITETMNQGNYITYSPNNIQNNNYISINSNTASTSGFRPNKSHNRRGHWLKDQWNGRRNERPWDIQGRMRNLHSKNRNLVPVCIQNNQFLPEQRVNVQKQWEVNNHNPFANSVFENNLQEVLVEDNISFCSHTVNSKTNVKDGGVSVDKNQIGNTLECGSRMIGTKSNDVGDGNYEGIPIGYKNYQGIPIGSNTRHVNDNIYTTAARKEKFNKDSSHEVVIVSDSEDAHHASDESVTEMSMPPKPVPPVIALDSSDESDALLISTSVPILNISGVSEGTFNLTRGEHGIDESKHMSSSACENNSASVSGTSEGKKKKKKKKKKREKDMKSFESTKWTSGMIQFYNHSWGGETYDHIKLQQRMTNNPSKWRILEIDKYGPVRDTGPLARIRCANCNQFGHLAKQCPDPKKIRCCSMCGQQGHSEHQCPNKICLKCGRPAPVFNDGCPSCWKKDHPRTCSTCGGHDHFNWLCPNVWRRFHSITTSEEITSNELQAPQYKTNTELSCCYCAGKGHTAAMCPFLSKQSGSFSNNVTSNIFATVNILTKKRKKKRNSYFDGWNKQEFNRKRRKTN